MSVRELLRRELDRGTTVLRVAFKTELAKTFSVRGLVAIARALADGGANPALVYRIFARDRPHAPAIISGPGARVLTYGELYERMTRVASALQRRGVRTGASVLIVLENRPEFVIAQNAVALLGASAVTASFHASAAELSHLASHSRAALAITEHDLVPRVREAMGPSALIVSVGASDASSAGVVSFDSLAGERADERLLSPSGEAAVVVYTSGTTGRPKGTVRHFPRDALTSTMKFIESTPMRAGDVHLVAAPLYHSTAYAFATITHLLGGTVVLLDGFTPRAFIDALVRHRVTTTAVVPTMLHRLVAYLDEEPDARATLARNTSLRAVFSGGAPLSAALATRTMEHLGDVLFNFYGATETGLVTLATPADLRRAPGTIGRALPGVEVRLVGQDGRDVGAGESGELYAKSALLAGGYLRDETATREASLSGFFSVGDLARVDREGRYFLEGRKRDLVITGGVNVYPIEVEHALEEHPEVSEAAVVGVPDEEWGERVRAYVVLRAGSSLDADGGEALRAWMKARVASAKVPREIRFLRELPRNPTGKIVKSRLGSS